MEKQQPNHLSALWADVKEYITIYLERAKLSAIERTARLVADLMTNTIMMLFLCIAFFASTITLAFYLSQLLGSYTAGFGCAVLFFTLTGYLLVWKKNAFESYIRNITIQRYFVKQHRQQEQDEEDSAENLRKPENTKKIAEKLNVHSLEKNTMAATENQQQHKNEQHRIHRKITFKGIWEVLKNSFTGFGDHKVTKLSGSLAYYTVFSMAPLLVVIISLCGIFLGQEAAQGQIYGQLAGFMGKETALQLQDIVSKAAIGDKSTVAFIIGIVTLLVGATTVFGDIQDSINTIWGLKPKPKRGWLKMLQNRFLSFSVIISLAFLLLVSLGITTILDGFSNSLKARFADISVVLFYIINQIVTLAVVSLIFGVIFKVLPDARIKWRDVIYGAVVTALLFMLGKFGISIYIGQSDVGSTYGAAGSLVILLLWTYYSSIILYFGAEFTKAYAIAYGSEIHPSHYAVTTKEVEIETGNNSIQDNES
ncbi:YihY/virulence factor BrkB family protein [Pedobacter sp. AW31-3R]|uniref:YihY/virulence factor BrkB family protein n=1 Tax=Pedobacter sp. AW31-3R TaxID=3445781 RepID=UPI003F9F0922